MEPTITDLDTFDNLDMRETLNNYAGFLFDSLCKK